MTVDTSSLPLDLEQQSGQRLLPPLAFGEDGYSIRFDPLTALPEQVTPFPEVTLPKRWDSTKGIVAGAGIAATGVFLTQMHHLPTPYQGKFQLVVASPASKLNNPAAVKLATAVPEFDYETQARVLWSPKFVSPVVRRLQSQYPDLNDDAVLQNLKVTHEPGSNRLSVSYRDSNREKVQVVLEQLAQDYLQYSRECHTASCRAIQLIDQRLPQLQNQIAQTQEKLRTLQKFYGNQSPDQFGRTLNQRIQATTQQKSDTQIRLTETRARALVFQRQLGLDQLDIDRLLQQDTRYSSLLDQFRTVSAQLATELSQSQVDAARVTSLRQQHTRITRELSKAAQNAILKNSLSLQVEPTNYQAKMRLQTLQQWVDLTYQTQATTISQAALTQIENQLKVLVKQWAGSMFNYAQAQQELKTASNTLKLHQKRKLELQAQGRPQPSIKLVAPPINY